jgi:hypothetical protein
MMPVQSLAMASRAAGSPHEGHWPNLQTLLMVDKAIKEAVTQPKRTALWLSLP